MALAIGNNQQRFTFRMIGASQRAERIRSTAEWVAAQFEKIYDEFLEVPHQAKAAFEQQNHGTSIWLSRHRLSLYSDYIHRMGAYLKAIQPNISFDVDFLNDLESLYWQMMEGRYEADVAYAFMHSIRRMVYRDEWKPVGYTFWETDVSTQKFPVELLHHYEVAEEIEAALIEEILQLPDFAVPYADLAGDARLIAVRISRFVRRRDAEVVQVEMIDAGFYRNRGAYLVGRIRFAPNGRLLVLPR